MGLTKAQKEAKEREQAEREKQRAIEREARQKADRAQLVAKHKERICEANRRIIALLDLAPVLQNKDDVLERLNRGVEGGVFYDLTLHFGWQKPGWDHVCGLRLNWLHHMDAGDAYQQLRIEPQWQFMRGDIISALAHVDIYQKVLAFGAMLAEEVGRGPFLMRPREADEKKQSEETATEEQAS